MTEELPEAPASEADEPAPVHDELRHLPELVVLDDEGSPMPYEEAAAWLEENVQDRKDEFRSYLTDKP
ncbi:hypothetical protein ABZ942_36320 [Nocardia sp. NPDC046473]|uniref:hypothetical protein n=1 Tax=Nocardia sp. NPDC046473 TaxID=3155733 RepID=UPI003403C4E7